MFYTISTGNRIFIYFCIVNYSMKPANLKTVIFAINIFLLVVSNSQSDDYGGTPGNAYPISIDGEPLSGSNESAGDTDWFYINAESSRVYVIETFDLSPVGYSDTVLELYDTDGETLIIKNYQGGSQLYASKIIWAFETAGKYYIKEYQFYYDGTGDYKIKVTDSGPAPDDDHGDSYDTATTIIPDGTPVSGNMELPYDIDYFKFTATSDHYYIIQTLGLGESSDTIIALFNTDGNTTIITDDQSGIEQNSSLIAWKTPFGGTYYVAVDQFITDGTGTYSLEVQDFGIPETLNPNNTPVNGEISLPGDGAFYTVELDSTHLYTLTLTPQSPLNLFSIYLMDSDSCTVLDTYYVISETWDIEPPENHTNYLMVREDLLGGEFQIKLEDKGYNQDLSDINQDGYVNEDDLLIFHQAWHKLTPTPVE